MPIHEPLDERTLPSDLQEAIDACITSAIQSAPGLPLVNVLGATMIHLADSYNISTPLPIVISMRLDALLKAEEVTRLRAQSGSGDIEEYTYYPKGWRFEITPRGLAINPTPKPALLNQSLNDQEMIQYGFVAQTMSTLTPRSRVHVLNNFCPRCGSEGDPDIHFCNE